MGGERGWFSPAHIGLTSPCPSLRQGTHQRNPAYFIIHVDWYIARVGRAYTDIHNEFGMRILRAMTVNGQPVCDFCCVPISNGDNFISYTATARRS